MEFLSNIYTEQTGWFPVKPTRGYKYMTVTYEQDSNAIIVEPTKSNKGTDLKRAYKIILKTLKDRGLKLKILILDNECSNTL